MNATTALHRCRFGLVWITLSLTAAGGCTSFWKLGKQDEVDNPQLAKLLRVPEPPDLVREAAIPHGMQSVPVTGVAIVNALPDTGGPALPSGFRDMLLEEMKRKEIPNPNEFLERNDTALVQVRGNIPPGARRGDVLDLQVLTPPKTEATDLHGGWLLDTRMRHQKVLDSSVRSSEVLAVATGPILTRADHEGEKDEALQVQGSILSGGVVQNDRKIGLVLRPDFQHVKMSAAIAQAINNRFYFFDGSTRRGIAEPIEDDFIQLDVHPRYRNNVARLMAVVRAIGVAPESSSTQVRLTKLGERMKQPSKAADAALQLEGLGEPAIPTLLEAVQSSNPELRFYAAEALAYLDRDEAIDPLIAAIRAEPAFRAPALKALEDMEHHNVVEGLQRLMDSPSLETRYGGFCKLRNREDGKQKLAGQNLRGTYRLYQVPSSVKPAVVVSLRRKPEIVLFGDVQPLQIETFFLGPSGIMIRSVPDTGQLRISRFQAGKDDAFAEVDNSLAAVLEGLTEVGGGYGDAVSLLRMAKTKGILPDQLAFDPLPKNLRTYYRNEGSGVDESDEDSKGFAADSESESKGDSSGV
ncbi:flagellar basal body P-ring protein FlgI [Rhodopirellula sp. P2]|uniref:flagellar basal body P-ring protein FlgI n=1 Tax=Rhodopirellula sp. P2 TaxID=2127060 RepID=UPI002367DC67|nr:flagellar basal body P-ring protein FlgI [Rhodopirellula sp. P2]WDQ14704.1 flagellar basal body P-ring protein FlgI [Rhodopirellula sp. P2]